MATNAGELRRYWLVLARWWWLVVLATASAAGASDYVSASTAPVYSAATLILVDQAQDPLSPDYNSVLASEQLTQTYGQLITTRPILAKTIADLHLAVAPENLAPAVKTTAVRNTQLLQVTVEAPSPVLARDLANGLVRNFIDQERQEKLGQSVSSQEVLDRQLDDVAAQTKETSAALERARARGDAGSSDALQLQALLSQQQNTYSQLLHAVEQDQLDEARVTDQLRIVEPAEVPAQPVRPKRLLDVLLAAIVGLGLGLSGAFLIEYLDDTVKTAEDLEHAAGLVPLGAVTRIPWLKGRGTGLLTSEHARSPLAEAYRMVRTNVDFARLGHPGKVLLVTSSNEGEGKTTTVANLAVMMAQCGRRVVAVDSDLRRPALHRMFGLGNDVGLTTLLLEPEASVRPALQATPWPNLSVLSSGPIPPNPTELLGSQQMGGVLDRLQGEADVVLLDSPPVLLVADPAVLAMRTDGVILVVDSGRTRAEALVRAKEHLTRGSTRILGAVLNKLTTRATDYDDRRRSGYGAPAAYATKEPRVDPLPGGS